jgi:uncharacterized membrane protein YphA (DoxX/SURF4 family)
MQAATQPVPSASTSAARVWIGRIITILVAAFMLLDGGLHLSRVAPVVKAFAQLGFPLRLAVTLGIIEIVCVVLYVVPRTAVLGAILLTAYLGGAIAIQLRVGNPLFGETLFPLYLGVLVWAGLFPRDQRLRALIPLRACPSQAPASRKVLWGGRIISALVALMLIFAGITKVMTLPAMVQGFAQLGIPQSLIVVVGLLELSCTIVYLIPRTSVLGAILLAGLMGGATAINVRVGNPSLVVTILIGVLAWLGLYLRDRDLVTFMPFRTKS